MGVQVRELRRSDERHAIRFAAVGMNFDRIVPQRLLRMLYARYFWLAEREKANVRLAAEVDGRLVGVMLAHLEDAGEVRKSRLARAYVAVASRVAKVAGEDAYLKANERMLASFCERETPDGELCFLAADPENPVSGVGTALLSALEERAAGKLVFLYTDELCTWQFYEHRGFTREEEEVIVEGMPGSAIELTCFLYAKHVGTDG